MLSQQQFSLLPLPWQLPNSVTFRCLLDKWSLCIHTAEIFTYDNSYKEKRTEQDYIYRVKTTIKLQLINRQYNDIKTPQKHSPTSRLWTQFPRARLWYWEIKPRMTEINTRIQTTKWHKNQATLVKSPVITSSKEIDQVYSNKKATTAPQACTGLWNYKQMSKDTESTISNDTIIKCQESTKCNTLSTYRYTMKKTHNV